MTSFIILAGMIPVTILCLVLLQYVKLCRERERNRQEMVRMVNRGGFPTDPLTGQPRSRESAESGARGRNHGRD